MKRLFIFTYAIFSLCAVLFTGCSSDMEDSTASYSGTVHEASTNEPFPNIDVKVTDGSNIHVATKTDNDGNFKITVKINEINGSYYLLVGDATCEPKKVTLPGYAAGTTNLGIILVEGPQLPTVETNSEYSVDVNNLRCGGVVKNSGRLNVTDRGICYSTSSYPTIDDNKLSEGKGEGAFDVVIKDLKVNTSYYFRAFATNAKGTAYGAQYQVKMEEGLPVVGDIKISDIKATSAICEGSITGDGGFEITKRGICWADHQLPTTSDHFVTDNGKTGKFSLALSNLTPQTNYYVRAFAENSSGISYSEQVSFETISGLATVQTGDITNISSTSANCSGTISDTGGYSITKCGVCWSQTSSTPTVNDSHTEDVNLSGKFNSTISPLKASIEYYVRAYATNSMGTVYGQTKKFTTTDGRPVVSTNQPTATATTINASGVINDDGGYPIIECGICYSTTTNTPSISNSKVISEERQGVYYVTIPGLSVTTLYYLRAYAKNQNGTSYGQCYSISTTSGKPVVKTNTTYSRGRDYLVISGTATSEEDAPITRKGICWSMTSNPSVNDNVEIANSNTESFSCRIEGLQSWSAYYCRAFAENSYGISYGETYLFSTEETAARLMGRVCDQDGNPIASASVGCYTNAFWHANTDKDGYYVIQLAQNSSGNYQFAASANGYNGSEYQTINIVKGQDNHFDFVLNLTTPWAIDLGTGIFQNTGSMMEILFECTQSSFAGQKTSRHIRLKNNRSVPVSWNITNIPTTGVTLSQTSGTVPANGETSFTLTFTYPSTSSYMVKLPGCSSGTKTYIYNWDEVAPGYYCQNGVLYEAPCCACCWQNPIVTVGGYSEAFSLILNQRVSYK